jgi:uncharacterized protein YchJ
MRDCYKENASILKGIIQIAVVALSISCQSTKDDRAKEAVMELEREMTNAYVRGDTKTLDRIYADNLTTTAEDWKVVNKADNLKRVRALGNVHVEISEIDAGLTRDKMGAIVTGVTAFKDGDNVKAYRFSDGFAKRDNRWQLISSDHRELKPLTVQPCQSSKQSVTSGGFTFVRFTNVATQTVVITALNYQAIRDENNEEKMSLVPGKSGIFHTHVGQRLAVTDVSGKCLGVYDATEEQSLAVIK